MTTFHMNKDAMALPRTGLLDALKQRIAWKRGVLEERDQTCGKDRVHIWSYMENIALPELFGFDMNDLFRDPHLAIETELRYRIFWADNSPDDACPGLEIGATAGHYYDMTLFGAEIWHRPNGVPEFGAHAIARTPDLAVFKPFDFRTTGSMPGLIRHTPVTPGPRHRRRQAHMCPVAPRRQRTERRWTDTPWAS